MASLKRIGQVASKSGKKLFRPLRAIDPIMLVLIGVVAVCFIFFSPSNAKGYAIAASIALFIAFVAYPWQKALDREIEMGKERRSGYRDFLEKWVEIEKSLIDLSRVEGSSLALGEIAKRYGDILRKVEDASLTASLTASEGVFVEISELHKNAYGIGQRFVQILNNADGEIDLEGLDQSGVEGVVNRSFREAVQEFRDFERKKMSEILNKIRYEESGENFNISLDKPQDLKAIFRGKSERN